MTERTDNIERPERTERNDRTERISMTLPQSTLSQLDDMVGKRGYANRSQAITEIINKELVNYSQQMDETIMAGTITLFYNISRPGLHARLAQIQREYIDEVISSLHVQLEDNYTMEVVLIQGPAAILRKIADELTTCKGVKTGNLNLTTAILPPIHSKKGSPAEN